ncbi:hypothetical protein M3Y95_00913400 [Aphelenchoides besseyi]|nr:hypothetical protein M3Y95_00913400 [Aphelenchoides besseyi]
MHSLVKRYVVGSQAEMSFISTSNCSSTVEYYENSSMRLAGFWQIFSSVCVCLTFYYVYWRKRNVKLIPMHKNLRRMFLYLACLCVVHAICTICVQVVHEYKRRLMGHVEPCQLQWIAWQCIALRVPVFVTFPAYTLIHFGITIERALAIVLVNRYEHMNGRLSYLVLFLVLFGAILNGYTMLKDAEWSSKHDYCTLSSIPSVHSIGRTINVLTILNIPILLTDVCLFCLNGHLFYNTKRAQKSPFNTLSKSYQLRENFLNVRITAPFVLSHFVTENIYLGLNVVVRNFVAQSQLQLVMFAEWTYILMFIYAILAIYVPFYFRQKRRTFVTPTTPAPFVTTVNYFSNLNNQFNSAYVHKHGQIVMHCPK